MTDVPVPPPPTGTPLPGTDPEGPVSRVAPDLPPGSLTAADLKKTAAVIQKMSDAFARKVVGQEQLRESIMATLIADGHILLESVPGLAKSTAASTLADAVQGEFRRIQCTPDLLPSDIIGTQIYDARKGEFSTQLGPGARQHRAARRDQPVEREDPERDARGDAGAADLDRRNRLQAADAVPGDRDPEPDRAGGHLPAARGAARPLPAQGGASTTPTPRTSSRS